MNLAAVAAGKWVTMRRCCKTHATTSWEANDTASKRSPACSIRTRWSAACQIKIARGRRCQGLQDGYGMVELMILSSMTTTITSRGSPSKSWGIPHRSPPYVAVDELTVWTLSRKCLIEAINPVSGVITGWSMEALSPPESDKLVHPLGTSSSDWLEGVGESGHAEVSSERSQGRVIPK